MHLEILVEEPSCEAALDVLVPRIISDAHSFRLHSFNGKQDLLSNLPARLSGYRSWLPQDWRVVVLIDEDRQDCMELKRAIEEIARASNLVSRSAAGPGGRFEVLSRIAVEELEAWFFGDVDALVAAYPRVPPSLGQKAPYRDPDAIAGGTWESLERVLQRAGYYQGGLRKIELARTVAAHMDPERNRSRSFQVFRDGLRTAVL